jgi:hypothetical protein
MKKEDRLSVLADFPYNPIGSFTNGNPYTIAFCYTNPLYMPAYDGRFMVKGGNQSVEDFLRRLHIPMLAFKTFWRYKRARAGYPHFVNFKNFSRSNQEPYIRHTNLVRMDGRSFYRNTDVIYLGKTLLTFRRFPRKWLTEYDAMILM